MLFQSRFNKQEFPEADKSIADDVAAAAPPLRIVVTSRCNLRCEYCSIYGENLYSVNQSLPENILPLAINTAKAVGIRHYRLTGGEPLLDRDRLSCILHSLPNESSIHLTTNGTRLRAESRWLASFQKLSLVKVSLDAVDPGLFQRITGARMLEHVFEGIDTARSAGLDLRINTVVSTQNVKYVPDVMDWCAEQRLDLKLFDVNFFDNPGSVVWDRMYVSLEQIKEKLRKEASDRAVALGFGGYGIPMNEYLWHGIKVTVKDSAIGATYGDLCRDCPYMWHSQSKHYCQEAFYNLTLTIDGKLITCRHRPDLAVPLNDGGETSKDLRSAFECVLKRYESARLLFHE